ncbi:DUF3153 domain-containing protein [Kamptonema animale CS-326]|jgi:hypothetical protein|uniref:DUF3153 domain-containing protein n=1 Tax=Kamptonema animale TaxID=92934 RepID=UPI00232BE6E8|nr:DUF3153 domain-containing protein [Kamptonema animale]MDB9510570.1 DUF3153 domain-containing protein [Kamptonema animale CS-326]
MKEQKNRDETGKRKKPILFLLPFAFCILTMLGGCVNYDVGVNFDSQTHGEIVQHIKLGERLTSFSTETVREWLDSIDRRVRSLQGRTKRLSDSEVTVRIPFNNGAELEEKFNQFFNPVEDQNDRVANSLETDLPKFGCHINVDQNNFVLFLRNRLTLELDLRSLSLLSSSGNVLVSPGQLLGLEFSLRTPWGAKSIEAAANGITPSIEAGNQLTWKLKPGEINYLEAIFWLPSPVGIGTVIIALLVLAGSYLKYQLLPAIGIGKRQPASEVKV